MLNLLLTQLVFNKMHVGRIGRRRWASFVDSNNTELVLASFFQITNFTFKFIPRYFCCLFPIRFESERIVDVV
jgi:hypothetical protein